MKHPFFNFCIALTLACNYFAFQVEPFENEYEENHPPLTSSLSISGISTSWESFDKENAPEAFTIDAGLHLDCLLVLQPVCVLESPARPSYQLIRDKSPPVLSSSDFQCPDPL